MERYKYIEAKKFPRANLRINTFSTYMEDYYLEMQISEPENGTYYLSLTGKFLGNTEEEVNSKIWE